MSHVYMFHNKVSWVCMQQHFYDVPTTTQDQTVQSPNKALNEVSRKKVKLIFRLLFVQPLNFSEAGVSYSMVEKWWSYWNFSKLGATITGLI